MPRKAKEKIDENEIIDEKKSVVKKSTKKASATSSKETVSKKSTSKKVPTRKSALAKIIESVDLEAIEEKPKKRKTTVKAESSEKPKKVKTAAKAGSSAKPKKTKATVKTAPAEKTKKTKVTAKVESTEKPKKKAAAKENTETKTKSKPTKKEAKKTDSEKKVAKKQPAKKTSQKGTKTKKQPVQILEYYDLPYKYGNTVVRLLAQTPKTLFVYWEVSDADIESFKKTYGDDFFNKTRPILIVHNLTLNKTTEIEINDFANCWYLNTDDTDCKFDIELARKFIDPNSDSDKELPDYLSVAQSNNLQSPNNHILFEKLQEFVVFRDVNNDKTVKKNIKSFKFLEDIYKFYRDMYDEEVLNNPSSQFKF